jgi:DNA repair protein RadB
VETLKTKPKKRIPTGCLCLDRLLHGGLPSNQLTVFYGEAATGKTTIALQYSVNCARNNFQVIYLDGDGAFPVERLKQIAPDFDLIAPLILVFTPKNFFEQTVLVEKLELYLSGNVGLIVVDTINNLYRVAIKDSETTFILNKELNRQLAYLAYYTKTYNIPVLVTSQVHSSLEEGKEIEPVATRALNYWASNIIRLSLNPKPGVRTATLERLDRRSFTNVFCHFKLSDSGVE